MEKHFDSQIKSLKNIKNQSPYFHYKAKMKQKKKTVMREIPVGKFQAF